MAAKSSEPMRTSIPSREIEMRTAKGPSKCESRQWTPEEEAYYKSLPKPVKAKQQIKTVNEQHQQRKNIPDQHQEAQSNMGNNSKDNPGNGLTKEILLEQLASGETVGSIEKAWKMKYNTLPYWVKKWGLQGIKPEQAATMVEQAKEQAAANVAAAQSGTEIALLREKALKSAESPHSADEEIKRLKRIEEETRELEVQRKAQSQEDESRQADTAALQARVMDLETENQCLQDALVEEKKVTMTLRESVNGIRSHADMCVQDLEDQLRNLSEAHERDEQQWQQRDEYREIELRRAKDWAGGLEAQITELETKLAAEREEKAILLQTIELAADSPSPAANMPPQVVTLTYALRDFGGDRISQRTKCIEEADEYSAEIETANINLSRTAAELFDAGQSFVGLIRKSFQELLVPDPDLATQQYFEQHNQRHLAKMQAKVLGL